MQLSIATSCAVSVLLIGSAAWAQSRAPVSLVPRLAAGEESDGIDGGLGVIVETRYEDDSVPLPEPAMWEPGSTGDRLVAPPAGDPHFLGFAAGRHYPPQGELVDPELLAQLRSQWIDGRPAQETYAFVMFSKRISVERRATLESLGARILGFQPHYCLRVALEPRLVDEIAALDFVRWIGVPTRTQRVHPMLAERLARVSSETTLELYVDVHDSDLCAQSTFVRRGVPRTGGPQGVRDASNEPTRGGEVWTSNGWQQRALESVGARVVQYVDPIRAFRVHATPAVIERLLDLDFVAFVELDLPGEIAHDESTPMLLADYVRATWNGGTSHAVCGGMIDSGLDVDHEMLDHFWWGLWDFTVDGDGSLDNCNHGSHVGGTILGLPPAGLASLKGVAPRLGFTADRRFRSAKIFSTSTNNCTNTTALSTMLSYMEGPLVDGQGNSSPEPEAINNSWGSLAAAGVGYFGSEANARTIDYEVFYRDQLYVFAAGNEGPTGRTIRLEGSAKDALTVGSFDDFSYTSGSDPGTVSSFSSRGPCRDWRWKPELAAPGSWIRSADSGTSSGYIQKQGTSMATPHVTGLALQLADHYSWLRHAPARLAAQLMGTAITGSDSLFYAPSASSSDHLNIFGAGRANAAFANSSFSDSYWASWGGTLTAGQSTYADFTLGANCKRIVVCLRYHERDCSPGASQALVNNLDLFIDDPTNGLSPATNVGEHVAQQSPINNTEIRSIGNPAAGTWRWKIHATSTTGDTKYGLTVAAIYGDTTPDGTLTLSASDLYLKPNETTQITASVQNPSYFASCVFLDASSAGSTIVGSSTTLRDGAVTDLMGNPSSGADIVLGALRPGETSSGRWNVHWASEGVQSWNVGARSDNWVDEQASLAITVDGTLPGAVTNLVSTTHTPNVWSSNPSVTWAWTAATDNLSGIDGYGILLSTAQSLPIAVKSIEESSSYAQSLISGSWYFNIRSVDNCGNWDDAQASVGPYKIDLTAPSLPSAISSSTHTAGVQSCATTVTLLWSPPSDAHSGVTGLIGLWDTNASTDPAGSPNIPPGVPGVSSNIGSSSSPRWFHLRAKDAVGNYSATRHFGPVLANANSVSTYCTGKTNSLGCVPAIGTNGVQPDKSTGNFTVTCINALNQKNGLLFWGYVASAVPFQGGTKCVASPTVRTVTSNSGGSALPANNCSGTYSFTFDTAYMNANAIDPGDALFAQWWTRDPASPSTTGLSNAITFTVCE